MKVLKNIKLATLTLVILISGCSEKPPKDLNELPRRDFQKVPGEIWWDVSISNDFEPKVTDGEGVWLVIRNYHGSIIGHSAVVGIPNMKKSVRVVIQEAKPDRITAFVRDSNWGITLIIEPTVELVLDGKRVSGKKVNTGDTLIKWKIKGSSDEENTRNASTWNTIQEGEASLSLEEYQHKD